MHSKFHLEENIFFYRTTLRTGTIFILEVEKV